MIAPALLGLVQTPASADALADGFRACRTLSEAKERLACFDKLMPPPDPVDARIPSAAAPSTQPSPSPPPSPQDRFGAETVSKPTKAEADEPSQIQATLLGYYESLTRGQRYTLDNGQVWINVDDGEVYVSLDNPKVTIKRNFIGSYWMQVDARGASVRVRRAQ